VLRISVWVNAVGIKKSPKKVSVDSAKKKMPG
jgi:hypothetical protein